MLALHSLEEVILSQNFLNFYVSFNIHAETVNILYMTMNHFLNNEISTSTHNCLLKIFTSVVNYNIFLSFN